MSMKNRILKWLGLDTVVSDIEQLQITTDNIDELQQELNRLIHNIVKIGVDVGYKGSTTIIIVSPLNKGYVNIIDTKIRSMEELRELVQSLKEKYNTTNVVADDPNNFLGYFK